MGLQSNLEYASLTDSSMVIRVFTSAVTLLVTISLASCDLGAGNSEAPTGQQSTPQGAADAPSGIRIRPSVRAKLAPPARRVTRRQRRAQNRFARQVRAVCKRLPRPPAISVHTRSSDERAREMRAEARWLKRLKHMLRRAHPIAHLKDAMHEYRAAVRFQRLIDRRIARAAANGDMLMVDVGMTQNKENRRVRTQRARELALPPCMFPTKPS
jgi:hypothetical protein